MKFRDAPLRGLRVRPHWRGRTVRPRTFPKSSRKRTATWASSRPTSRTDTVRHGWAHTVTDGQAHWDSPVRTSTVRIREPQQYADADRRGTQVRCADGQPRISRFDGMVMWHKLCRKLFHEKKANVLMQVAVGLRALPHSTIGRACTEPDIQCCSFARKMTPHSTASRHPRIPNKAPMNGSIGRPSAVPLSQGIGALRAPDPKE